MIPNSGYISFEKHKNEFSRGTLNKYDLFYSLLFMKTRTSEMVNEFTFILYELWIWHNNIAL